MTMLLQTPKKAWRFFALFLLISNLHLSICKAQVTALPNGFAHNDYLHKHPLFEALEDGYTNIEADIFLHNKQLVVAHYFPYFKQGHTLEHLYLKPLADYIAQHNGVYENYDKPIILMIDIKSSANKTYQALKPYLEKYAGILSSCKDGKFIPGKVTVVLSGNKPFGVIEKEDQQLAFFDTDFRHLNADNKNGELYQMSSCKYSKIISWRGEGELPDEQKQKLINLISIAHAKGRKVRLWASPENKAVWDQLLNCGVDFINTDKLPKLKSYLLARNTL